MHMSESVAGVKFMVSGRCVYGKSDILKLTNISNFQKIILKCISNIDILTYWFINELYLY